MTSIGHNLVVIICILIKDVMCDVPKLAGFDIDGGPCGLKEITRRSYWLNYWSVNGTLTGELDDLKDGVVKFKINRKTDTALLCDLHLSRANQNCRPPDKPPAHPCSCEKKTNIFRLYLTNQTRETWMSGEDFTVLYSYNQGIEVKLIQKLPKIVAEARVTYKLGELGERLLRQNPTRRVPSRDNITLRFCVELNTNTVELKINEVSKKLANSGPRKCMDESISPLNPAILEYTWFHDDKYCGNKSYKITFSVTVPDPTTTTAPAATNTSLATTPVETTTDTAATGDGEGKNTTSAEIPTTPGNTDDMVKSIAIVVAGVIVVVTSGCIGWCCCCGSSEKPHTTAQKKSFTSRSFISSQNQSFYQGQQERPEMMPIESPYQMRPSLRRLSEEIFVGVGMGFGKPQQQEMAAPPAGEDMTPTADASTARHSGFTGLTRVTGRFFNWLGRLSTIKERAEPTPDPPTRRSVLQKRIKEEQAARSRPTVRQAGRLTSATADTERTNESADSTLRAGSPHGPTPGHPAGSPHRPTQGQHESQSSPATSGSSFKSSSGRSQR